MIANRSLINAFSIALVAVLATIMLTACADEGEQSMTFHDEYLEQNVVRKLESEEIPFRREGTTIWYSISDQKVVKRIFNEMVARRPVQYKFFEKEKQSRFVSLLDDQGIVASAELNNKPPYVVNVPNEYRDQAEETFRKILRGE